MRAIVVVCIVGAAGCTTPLRIDGAPCPCPGGYVCQQARCVSALLAIPPAIDSGVAPEVPPPAACVMDPGPAIVRWLDADEYRNTVLDLLGVVADVSALPPVRQLPLSIDPAADPAAMAQPPPQLAAVYADLASNVAAQAVMHPMRLFTCVPDPPGQSGCARKFVESFGPRAYRRPLEPAELDGLVSVFEQHRADPAGDLGLRRMLEAMLTAPAFLARSERGAGSGPRAGVVALTSWEIAARLSYFLWATTPETSLSQRAGAGQLSTRDDVGAAVDALLASPRAEVMVGMFHRRWLGLDDVRDVEKSAVMPPFDTALRDALVTSGQQTTSRLMWERGLDQSALFGGLLMGNRAMAEFYGLSLPGGSGFEELAPLGDQRRFGVLTFPAVLATFAHDGASAPVQRGHFIVSEILCRDLPPPPAGVAVPLRAPPQPNETTRQILSQHTQDPACSLCHRWMDPIGFGLENYDGLGRWRVKENGQAIDPSGTGEILGKPFDGPAGLAAILAGSDEVSECLVRQWLRFALGRALVPSDECTVTTLKAAFLAGGRTWRPLLKAIATSDAFLTKQAP